MIASGNVAQIIYGENIEKASRTYVAGKIRYWASQHMDTGEIPSHKQGCHIKTTSVITDETVMDLCRGVY